MNLLIILNLKMIIIQMFMYEYSKLLSKLMVKL